MIKSLKFSHKILLAAALVVIATFSLFTLYNDSLQRASIREDLEDYLHEMGEITASNVQNWLSGRILLIENLAQTLARDHSPETTQALLEPWLGAGISLEELPVPRLITVIINSRNPPDLAALRRQSVQSGQIHTNIPLVRR